MNWLEYYSHTGKNIDPKSTRECQEHTGTREWLVKTTNRFTRVPYLYSFNLVLRNSFRKKKHSLLISLS